jgi:pyrroloquinoline-quinone synthase
MDFATGMGADANEVRAREINAETRTLIAAFRQMMREQPASALAALYAYESRVPEIARTKAEGLAKHYCVDDATRRYFTLHEKADVFHARVWREALKAEVGGDAAAEESACNAAEKAARLLWSSLDGVERNRQERKKQQA